MTTYAHDYAAARKQAGNKLPVLQFRAGDKKVLLPHGQQINLDTFRRQPTTKTAKAVRRERISLRRQARELVLANDGSLYDKDHEGDIATLENAMPESALLINEVHIDDRGWAVIPFGDWPHEMGMQKFQREQAEEIASGFNNMAGRFRRAVVGLPIFKGHPDHPVAAIANQYPDKEEKGQIAAVEVRPNGLALKLILSNAGAELVRKGWKFISPMWIGQLISKAGEAFRTYAPSELRSVGLVVKPNIPSPSLANNAASAANPNNKSMNPKLLALLGLAADATPEQIETAIATTSTRLTTLANEAASLVTTKGELTALQGKVTVLENAATAATSTITETRTALANERKARIGDHVAAAIRTGRCTEAEKPTWVSRLEANFESESAVLANAAPKVKTASDIPAMLKVLETQMRATIDNAASGGADDGDDGKDECGMGNADYGKLKPEDKAAKMKALINDHMGKLAHTPESVRYNSAFANAKKANPRLFGFKAKDVQ